MAQTFPQFIATPLPGMTHHTVSGPGERHIGEENALRVAAGLEPLPADTQPPFPPFTEETAP